MSKIYCYVDESGQHTQGNFFSVAAVIVKTVEMRDSGENTLLEVERTTENAIRRFGINRLRVRSVVWLCVDTVLLASCWLLSARCRFLCELFDSFAKKLYNYAKELGRKTPQLFIKI